MKLGTGAVALLLGLALVGLAPCGTGQSRNCGESQIERIASDRDAANVVTIGATAEQEGSLRCQIEAMRPEVRPLRVFFLPHSKYMRAARDFRLHVPTGMSSLMFTHLPSRTIFIDDDRYLGGEWLGYWMAHELGHLATNSAKEEDAERAARKFRERAKTPGNCKRGPE